MKNKRGKRILAALLSVLLCGNTAGPAGFFTDRPEIAYGYTERQATVGATSLNVRSAAGTDNSVVAKLSYGAAVTVANETKDASGTTWYQIRFTTGSGTKEGYVSAEYIKFPVSYTTDASFEAYLTAQGFPESYKDALRELHAEYPNWVFQAQQTGLDWETVIQNEAAVGANLVDKNSISSWKSTEYGAYDWNTGVWTGFDGATWVAASRDIVCYYMDPRNFLNDVYVFQFLLHTYDAGTQTKEGLMAMIRGTYLDAQAAGQTGGSGTSTDNTPGITGSAGGSGTSLPGGGSGSSWGSGSSSGSASQTGPGGTTGSTGNQALVSIEGPGASSGTDSHDLSAQSLSVVEYGPGMDASVITGDNTGASDTSPVPTDGQTYADIIMKAAAQSGVNPYVLAAMLLQEQGNGKSGSISGTTAGYEGYYNFFNIGAYATDSMSAITRGLWYASQQGSYGRPWNSIEKSIVGGSTYYGENFVKQGQDTFYLKKFNVQGNNLYKHQYMTNVEAAAGEGAKLANAYTDELKKQKHVFKIPVYTNMPSTACTKPTVSGSPNNKLSSLGVEGYTLTPTFGMDTQNYDIIVDGSVSSVNVTAKAIDSKAVISGTGTVSLNEGSNTVKVDVKAENGDVRTYQLNIVRQGSGSGTGNSGQTMIAPDGSSQTGPGQTGGPGSTGQTSGPGGSSPQDSGTSGPGGSNVVIVPVSTSKAAPVSMITGTAAGKALVEAG